jgi:hypothetical protein
MMAAGLPTVTFYYVRRNEATGAVHETLSLLGSDLMDCPVLGLGSCCEHRRALNSGIDVADQPRYAALALCAARRRR